MRSHVELLGTESDPSPVGTQAMVVVYFITTCIIWTTLCTALYIGSLDLM